MGLDLDSLWGEAKKAAETGMNDLLKQGGNAGLGYLEQQAINTLQADKAQHEASYAQAVKDKLNQPSSPDSFGSYLSKITQSPVLQNYGIYIIGAVAVVVIVTLVAKGK